MVVVLHLNNAVSSYYDVYLMFLWQVEFWLAKNLLLALHGRHLFLHQTNHNSLGKCVSSPFNKTTAL